MDGDRLNHVIEQLRRAVGPGPAGGLSDADLLARWVAGRDEAAFEVLLWRHAPLVLGVCRRVLRDAHEAEDAAQATFLALALKAGSVARRGALAGWLYRVAYRVALQAKARAARRPRQDARALEAAARPDEGPVWRDLRPVLDDEVSRLPAKYRVPFLLCCVEGRTNEEAARELGCPVGTVLSRLARARERLRVRLARRDLAPSAGALAVAVSAEFVGPTVKAASAVAAGRAAGAVSSSVNLLFQGALRGMLMTRVKMAATVLVVTAALVGTGAGVFGHRLRAERPAAQADPRPGEVPAAPGKAADAPARGKAEDDRRREARAILLKRLLEQMKRAEEHRHQLEDRWKVEVLPLRLMRIEEEERLRLLERTQAAEREREQAELLALAKEIRQPGKDADKARVRLEALEVNARKREEERTEALIKARQSMAKVEEALRPVERRLGHQLDQAEVEEDATAAGLREAEGLAAPPESPRPRELERKLDALLREMTELRRAVEGRRPERTRPRER
jgi:RNA polymerase sigma factor (sigma-70 family)